MRDIDLLLQRNKGSKWPDALGCGAEPLFIVSKRVIEDWKREGIGDFPTHKVVIASPYPKKLENTKRPEYLWLEGEDMLGAKIDFEASGYVGVVFCSKCGRRSDDISATYDRHHSGVWPEVIIPGSWNGSNIFTTDISQYAFFCTELVLECAKKYRHMNFQFIPIERSASSLEGIKYLSRGKNKE